VNRFAPLLALAALVLLAFPSIIRAEVPSIPFVVIDRAKQIDNFWTPTIRQETVDAVNGTMAQFGAYWNVQAHVYLDSDPHPAASIRIVLDDRLDGGNDGIHYNAGFIRIHVHNCFLDEIPVSADMSHEVEEFMIDPLGITAINSPFGLILTEVADPVTHWFYPASNGRMISDFVTPAWFGITSAAPYDALNRLTSPFQLAPGGYVFLAYCRGSNCTVP
jgi:hypothetical protein